MNTHTPGPWFVDVECGFPMPITQKDDLEICRVGKSTASSGLVVEDPDEAEANAYLIAAAPELLDACALFTQAAHEVRDLLNDRGLACPASLALAAEFARNAIVKVEGR